MLSFFHARYGFRAGQSTASRYCFPGQRANGNRIHEVIADFGGGQCQMSILTDRPVQPDTKP
jgi:hypothetical protein